MSLATRCKACGTVFRVVQDQLKVSEGWVRCGRCGEVFNALEGLFDLEGASGPMGLPREAGSSVPGGLAASVSPPAVASAAPGDAAAEEAEHAEPAASAGTSAMEEADDDSVATTAIDTQVDTRSDSTFTGSQPASPYNLDLIDSQVPDEALLDLEAEVKAASEPAPSFLRAEARAAQWQRPRVRRALTLLASLLGLILLLQVTVMRRDELAARWPAAMPALVALCGLLGCEVEAPRSLEALAVDSSGLTRVDGVPLYRLQVVLRNRAATFVRTPALDLTLTNLRGEVIARRVLQPSDFGHAAPSRLAGGADWPINALLDVGDARVAGYTVELFYP